MAWIEIIEGPCKGICVELTGSKLTVGRTTYCDLYLSDSSVSRRHVEIWNKDNHYALVDVGSSNGTTLNTQPLQKFLPQTLNDQDEFIIGSCRIIFHSIAQHPLNAVKLPLSDNSTTHLKAKTDILAAISSQK